MNDQEFAVVLRNLIIVSTILLRDEAATAQYIELLRQTSETDPLLEKMRFAMGQIKNLS